MRKISSADYLSMPWKNGSGITTQLAIEPPGADLDAFGWRVSTAHVEAAGPFSLFAGIDRSIAVLQGSGMAVDLGGMHTAILTPENKPFVFRGEQHVHATLLNGPVSDFNVMTRRTQWTHELQIVQLCGTLRWTLSADRGIVYCARGANVRCRSASDAEIDLAPGDAAMTEDGDGDKLTFSAQTNTRLYIVSLHAKGNSDAR